VRVPLRQQHALFYYLLPLKGDITKLKKRQNDNYIIAVYYHNFEYYNVISLWKYYFQFVEQ
jgi:hypothetical protein